MHDYLPNFKWTKVTKKSSLNIKLLLAGIFEVLFMTVLDVMFHILLIRQLISSWSFPTKKNPFWIQSCFLQKVVCKISSQPILLQSKAIVPKAIYSFHHFFHKLFPYSRTANRVKLKVNFHTASYYCKTNLFSQWQCMVFVNVFSIQELNA